MDILGYKISFLASLHAMCIANNLLLLYVFVENEQIFYNKKKQKSGLAKIYCLL